MKLVSSSYLLSTQRNNFSYFQNLFWRHQAFLEIFFIFSLLYFYCSFKYESYSAAHDL